MSSTGNEICVDNHRVVCRRGDLFPREVELVQENGTVGVDTETTGLNWRRDKIVTCQLAVAGSGVIILVPDGHVPERLAGLLANPTVKKVFHHAMFDLRFMASHWHVAPVNVACTKIASKLLSPRRYGGHTLKSLLWQYFGASIDKSLQTARWSSASLDRDRLAYAARDVIYLTRLIEKLMEGLRGDGLEDLALACFAHLPTRVALELRGYPDVFKY